MSKTSSLLSHSNERSRVRWFHSGLLPVLAIIWSSTLAFGQIDTTAPPLSPLIQEVEPQSPSQSFNLYGPDSASVVPGERVPFAMSPTPRTGPTFRLRGRIEADSISTDQNAANKADFGDLSERTGLRRARIGAEGHFTPDSRYIAEIDLASGQVVIRDLFLGLRDSQTSGEFKFGHMREPFSLEGGTSSNTFAFMERSPINTLDLAYNWGVSFNRCSASERSTFAIGLFKRGVDSNDFQTGNGSDSAVTGKWTGLLLYDETDWELMHIGFATSSRIPDNQVVSIRQAPRSPLIELGDATQSPFVSRLQIPASFQQLFNAQFAYARGPFWSQAEWYGTFIDQLNAPGIFYHGGYLATGYFLTGEHRAYQKQAGIFGATTVSRPFIHEFSSQSQPRPKGYGALELTARISNLDFIDSNAKTVSSTTDIGTRLPELTVGANWYLADRFRIMFNYDYATPYQSTTGASAVSVFAMRLAVFW